MKVLAVFMVLVGLLTAVGGALEFLYAGLGTKGFLVGTFATPASLFFAFAGLWLWRRGRGAHGIVLIAAIIMAAATTGGWALGIVGMIALLLGIIGAILAAGWALKNRPVTV